MSLFDELRKKTSAAAPRIKKAEEEEKRSRKQARLDEDIKKADGIIRDLPPLLKRAAEEGRNSHDVMRLEGDLHFTGRDVRDAKREYELHGMNAKNTFGGALKVVKWLTTQGLSIGLREDRHNDEGQGRAWSDLVLVASW